MPIASIKALVPADAVATSAGAAPWVGQVLRFPLLLLGVVTLLAILYRYSPDRADARWDWVSPGATVGAVLWLLVTGAFTVYVETFGSYDETYGSLAGVVVLLLEDSNVSRPRHASPALSSRVSQESLYIVAVVCPSWQLHSSGPFHHLLLTIELEGEVVTKLRNTVPQRMGGLRLG